MLAIRFGFQVPVFYTQTAWQVLAHLGVKSSAPMSRMTPTRKTVQQWRAMAIPALPASAVFPPLLSPRLNPPVVVRAQCAMAFVGPYPSGPNHRIFSPKTSSITGCAILCVPASRLGPGQVQYGLGAFEDMREKLRRGRRHLLYINERFDWLLGLPDHVPDRHTVLFSVCHNDEIIHSYRGRAGRLLYLVLFRVFWLASDGRRLFSCGAHSRGKVLVEVPVKVPIKLRCTLGSRRLIVVLQLRTVIARSSKTCLTLDYPHAKLSSCRLRRWGGGFLLGVVFFLGGPATGTPPFSPTIPAIPGCQHDY